MKILFFFHFVKHLAAHGARDKKAATRNRGQKPTCRKYHIRRLETTLPSSRRMLISPSS